MLYDTVTYIVADERLLVSQKTRLLQSGYHWTSKDKQRREKLAKKTLDRVLKAIANAEDEKIHTLKLHTDVLRSEENVHIFRAIALATPMIHTMDLDCYMSTPVFEQLVACLRGMRSIKNLSVSLETVTELDSFYDVLQHVERLTLAAKNTVTTPRLHQSAAWRAMRYISAPAHRPVSGCDWLYIAAPNLVEWRPNSHLQLLDFYWAHERINEDGDDDDNDAANSTERLLHQHLLQTAEQTERDVRANVAVIGRQLRYAGDCGAGSVDRCVQTTVRRNWCSVYWEYVWALTYLTNFDSVIRWILDYDEHFAQFLTTHAKMLICARVVHSMQARNRRIEERNRFARLTQ